MALLGTVAIITPVMLGVTSSAGSSTATWLLLSAGIEGATVHTFAGLGVAGLLAGFFTRGHIAALAASTFAVVILMVVADLVRDKTSHNLLPFELIMYALMALPAFAGLAMARGFRKLAASELRTGAPTIRP